MASGWVKSLQCKSRAFEDVYHPTPKTLMSSVSCRKNVQNIKDVVETAKHQHHHHKPRKSKPPPPQHSRSNSKCDRPRKPEPEPAPSPALHRSRISASTRTHDPFLTELPEGHPSRNVVEIIFHTSWSPKAFSGRIEMIFKVQNGAKTVARFEEYREVVKSRSRAGSEGGPKAGSEYEDENARCVADGNEVMRFHCLGTPAGSGVPDAFGGAWGLHSGKGSAICTFSGSGVAHENAGGARGRRAMLVCRVVAGRVSKQMELQSLLDGRVGFDSVSGDNGELLVFDTRAVLPCFLIIYKL